MNGQSGRRLREEGASPKADTGKRKERILELPLKEGPAGPVTAAKDAKRTGRESTGKDNGNTPAKVELTGEELVEYAQLLIDEGMLSSMEQLRFVDKEVHQSVLDAGIVSKLRFISENEMIDGVAEISIPTAGGNGGNGKALSDGEMYRRICSECFGIGAGTQYVGGRKTSVHKLQAGILRMLKGMDHKLFRKCWDRMISQGAIDLDRQRDTASLIPSAPVRDEKLKGALEWAHRQRLDSIGAKSRPAE